jgi:hypothetical protein
MAYPDLTVFRKEDDIVLCWFPDPTDTTTQGRFMDGGMGTEDRATVEAALESLVVKVLARMGEASDESAAAFVESWNAILAARRNHGETALCQRLAMFGQDPYAEELPEAIEEAVDDLSFSSEVVQDLLSASTPDSLANDVSSTTSLLAGLPATTGPHPRRATGFVPRASGELLPYRAGYARVSEVREYLRLPDDEPLHDLDEVIERLMGKPVQAWQSRGESGICGVEAAVQINGVAAISAIRRRPRSDQRFLLGRALHHWLYATTDEAPQRLLTKGHDWPQATSRAFAAELLAPARALSRRLSGGADWERQDELAEEFQVSSMVIAHQIENHRLD